jgi:hypothetical protein
MYSTCLFCQSPLGRNESVEHFPVGRRLAFDAAKGRLWVVCRKCERWNLTPLEERWEAIEECERLFRDTRMRVSTEHIGLARVKEGLELVRIGEPQRPEMAAWRYGDQFGRRRRRQWMIGAGVVGAMGTIAIAGPMLGLVGAGALGPTFNLFNAARGIYRSRKVVRVPHEGQSIRVRLNELAKTKLYVRGDDVVLRLSAIPTGRGWAPSWRMDSPREVVDLTGEHAFRAAGALLPHLNHGGGSAHDVERAVGFLEDGSDPNLLFRRAAEAIETRDGEKWVKTDRTNLLTTLPTPVRLALEMASHEESERRALEGELHVLEAAWKDAEEIAHIADGMFLPESIGEDLARLKRRNDE